MIHRHFSHKRGERGAVLLLGTMSIPIIVGLLGLSMDLSIMYAIKARLQMACDGAAVAALRSLNLGSTIDSQKTAATTVAQEWFTANFAGNFMGATGTTAPTITVTQDTTNYITTVTVSASTTSPSYFMKYFNFSGNTIPATGQASRRNVVITLVLDRSGSMTNANNSYGGQTPCQVMVAAAKQFTGMFQEGTDYIGLVTFAASVNIAQIPTTNFQTSLGYTNSVGNSAGLLDGITCTGGTNTASGISIGWNENYQTQLPGALNVILLMTDGQPTAATYKYVTTAATDPTGTAQSVIKSNSACKDSTGVAISSGGNMLTHPTNWVGVQGNNGSTVDLSKGFSSSSNSYWSALSGPIGDLYGESPSTLYGVMPWYSPTTTYIENQALGHSGTQTAGLAPGCSFTSNSTYGDPTSDIAFVPPQDIFGNLSTGYLSVSTSTIQSASRISLGWSNVANVVSNLADNAANFARTAHNLPGGASYGANMIYVIGLGGNGGVNYTLLQRIANDPDASPDGGATYPAYAGYNSSQPVGKFVYSADASDLSAAFATIASEILRISK